LHAQGFDVVVTGHNPDTLAAARELLPDDAVVLAADARSLADTAAVVDQIRSRFGVLHTVLLNAGTAELRAIDAVDEALFDDAFAVNVKGQYFTLQAVLPLLADGGSVIVTGALAPTHGLASWSVVSATKGALMALVAPLAVELAPRGIRVNAVIPGPIDTPAFGKLGLDAEAQAQFADTLAGVVPLGRMGIPAEVAAVVGFLASPAAAYITGTSIAADGGMGVVA
jgi:NAD(P)-dependent dehydrogenase (short-subunit alcohol dehydrogenase family)